MVYLKYLAELILSLSKKCECFVKDSEKNDKGTFARGRARVKG
jgi:hypothetical protein